jgi:hypothetical protein
VARSDSIIEQGSDFYIDDNRGGGSVECGKKHSQENRKHEGGHTLLYLLLLCEEIVIDDLHLASDRDMLRLRSCLVGGLH